MATSYSTSTEELTAHDRVCGAHFISGEASMNHDSPDFVPSLFTCTERRKRKQVKRLFGHRRRRQKNNMEKEEIKTPSEVDSPVKDQSVVLMETESGISRKIQTTQPPLSSSVKEEEMPMMKEEEAEDGATTESQTTSSPDKTVQGSTFTPKVDKINPLLMLKPIITPEGCYQCEQCSKNFVNLSQLVNHTQLHEEERIVICKKCGVKITGQATFIQHQCVSTNVDTFPCNICDRSFTSIKQLKRHKLLHVKDNRKCSRCGVMFCQLHNQIVQIIAPSINEPVEESSVIQEQNEGNDLMPENSLLEQSQTDKSAVTVTPSLIMPGPTPSNPGPLSNTKVSLPDSHTNVLPEIPVSLLPKTSNESWTPPLEHTYSRTAIPSSQEMSTQPDSYGAFLSDPDFTPSRQLFSPLRLTSAFLNVTRNFEYISSKPVKVKKMSVKKIKREPPQSHQVTKNTVQIKKERIAYDLDIVL